MLLTLQSADTRLHRTWPAKSHHPTVFFLSKSPAPSLVAGNSAGQTTTDAK